MIKVLNKIDNFYIAFALFMITIYTTSSFSFMGMSIFGVILMMLYSFIYLMTKKVNRLNILLPNFIIVISLLFFLILRLNYEPGLYYTFDSDLKSYLYVLVYVIISYVLFLRFRNKKEQLYKIIRVVLIVHVSFFFIQLATYIIFNYNIDISSLLGGEGNRTGKAGFDIFRATGFLDEPSIYCGFVISFLCFLNLIKKTSLSLDVFISISILLSMSFAGYFMLLLYFINRYIKINAKYILLFVFFSIGCYFAIYSSSFLVDRVSSVISGDDSSTIYKVLYLTTWFSVPEYMYLGTGISNSLTRPDYFDAAYDFTFFGVAISTYGIIEAIIIFVLIFNQVRKCKIRDIIYFLIPLLKITVLHTPLFILIFLFLQLMYDKES